jgi:hypothetical protein
MRETVGERIRPIMRVDHTHIGDPERFARENIAHLRAARGMGAIGGKFWYTPRFIADTGFHFDNSGLAPIFEALVDLGMHALVHIGDPDCWFATRYRDSRVYMTKPEHYAPLERTLEAFPDLTVVGAHFGGDPENLDHLRALLDAHPNYYIDSSATKWVSREMSVKPDESRAFIVERADRILFGSDLVAFPEATAVDYASRYWVQRWLWEGKGPQPSPIPDPCAPWPEGPRVHGLDLPDDVLAVIYTENARQVFSLEF